MSIAQAPELCTQSPRISTLLNRQHNNLIINPVHDMPLWDLSWVAERLRETISGGVEFYLKLVCMCLLSFEYTSAGADIGELVTEVLSSVRCT